MDWLDDEFFNLGAFITQVDSDVVILAKGGSFHPTEDLETTSTPIFYLKDFSSNSYLKYEPHSFLKTSITELKNKYPLDPDLHFKSLGSDDEIYTQDFNQLKKSFNATLKKVVLISREKFSFKNTKEEKKHLFLKALHFGTGYPYGFWKSDYGIMGSTPEVLYSVNEQKLQTFALAGTAKIGEEEKLLHSKKDLEEHGYVVQDITEKLRSFSDTVLTEATTVTPFKKIIHLKTNITATLKPDTNFKTLTSVLSPTAALGGYPKEEAMSFIKQSVYGQKHLKRYFGSAFCMLSEEKKQALVMIRNIQWNPDCLIIESGGGVVASSELQKELEEISLKRNVIKEHYL